MDPMKPVCPEENTIAQETTVAMTPPDGWKVAEPNVQERLNKCSKCRSTPGTLIQRYISDGGQSHREYKVYCVKCRNQTGIHWSRELTIHEWNNQ